MAKKDPYLGKLPLPTEVYGDVDEAADETTEKSRYEAGGNRYTADRTDGYNIIRDHKQQVWITPSDIIQQVVYMMNDFDRRTRG